VNILKISKLMGQIGLFCAFGHHFFGTAPVLANPNLRSPSTSQAQSQNRLPVSPNPSLAQFLPITASVKLANQVVELEVTRTAEQQSRGLMYRDRLPDDRGMLFSFDPPFAVSFWMKNCAVPLDMVFIYQKKVVAIAANVPPCTQDPCPTYPTKSVLADQVIELRQNWARDQGLKVGDRVEVKFK
jgi:uncharacterized protein